MISSEYQKYLLQAHMERAKASCNHCKSIWNPSLWAACTGCLSVIRPPWSKVSWDYFGAITNEKMLAAKISTPRKPALSSSMVIRRFPPHRRWLLVVHGIRRRRCRNTRDNRCRAHATHGGMLREWRFRQRCLGGQWRRLHARGMRTGVATPIAAAKDIANAVPRVLVR